MATFSYEAANERGSVVKGTYEAEGRQGVIDYLVKRRLTPISIEEVGGQGHGLSGHIFERFTPIDRIIMMRNLGATARAGVSLIESLDILIADTTKKKMREILLDAKTSVHNGQPLSATFEKYKNYFPSIYVGMIKSAEASGQLGQTLDELAQYSEKIYIINHKIKSALSYPVLLFVGTISIVVMLMIFVLPRITNAFQYGNVELPIITKVLVAIRAGITKFPILDLVVLAVLTWLVIQFRRPSRKFFMRLALTVPVARELMKNLALVRFSRSLASMLNSGLPIVEALQLSAQSVSNDAYKKVLNEAVQRVTNGIPLSRTLKEYPKLFPRFFSSLVAVGEKSGTTVEILRSFSDFYDAEIDTTIKDLTTFLEPALLLFMGVVVGLVALSILLPIYQFVGNFT